MAASHDFFRKLGLELTGDQIVASRKPVGHPRDLRCRLGLHRVRMMKPSAGSKILFLVCLHCDWNLVGPAE